jgi:GNAT superfamily N-acetyltransferase
LHHGKRHGLGREMFERVQAWLKANDMSSMLVWVLENNHHARRFYEARGFVVVEQTDGTGNEEKEPDARYLWTRA